MTTPIAVWASIPSPHWNEVSIGPLSLRAYGTRHRHRRPRRGPHRPATLADAVYPWPGCSTPPAIPVAQAIGRLRNWFNQELYGRPTDLPWLHLRTMLRE